MSTRVGSPKTIPKVRLSPSIRKKLSTIKKKKSPTRTKAFRTHKLNFHTNPTINPETNRKIKINGATYYKLVAKYGHPKK